ncbi:hypothetical protein FGIG_09929 [Fasciola gigantica]|uniref:Uncharacterized protein n=1 Tax=Fasciola gigantica TaxID=46835 RepID=A0A504Z0U6_FASGI|nr:hypothetical protein FGIG_09929 [Fasciola gigantica]
MDSQQVSAERNKMHLISSDLDSFRDTSGPSVNKLHYELPQFPFTYQNSMYYQPSSSLMLSGKSPFQLPDSNLIQPAEWNSPLSSTPLQHSFLNNSSKLTCSPPSLNSESTYQDSSSQQDLSLNMSCPTTQHENSQEQQYPRNQFSFQFLEEILADNATNNYVMSSSKEQMESDIYSGQASTFFDHYCEQNPHGRIFDSTTSGCETNIPRNLNVHNSVHNQQYMQCSDTELMPHLSNPNTETRKDSAPGLSAYAYPSYTPNKAKPFQLCTTTHQSCENSSGVGHSMDTYPNITDHSGWEPLRQQFFLNSPLPSSGTCVYDYGNQQEQQQKREQQLQTSHQHHPQDQTDYNLGTSRLLMLNKQIPSRDFGSADSVMNMEETQKGVEQNEADSNYNEQVDSVIGLPLGHLSALVLGLRHLKSSQEKSSKIRQILHWDSSFEENRQMTYQETMQFVCLIPETPLFYTASTQVPSANTYFWQYNAQCKGPKALRLIELDGQSSLSRSLLCGKMDELACSLESTYFGPMDSLFSQQQQPMTSSSSYGDMFGLLDDKEVKFPRLLANSTVLPYSLPDYPLVMFEDPVQRRYDLVHCSKLRRGDGNDVTPNLTRLRSMGEELECLNEQLLEHGEIIVAGTTGVSSPANPASLTTMVMLPNTAGVGKHMGNSVSPVDPNAISVNSAAMLSGCKLVEQAKREKNKLASKICRLKKKAFHEANKIKYTGLELEYSEFNPT